MSLLLSSLLFSSLFFSSFFFFFLCSTRMHAFFQSTRLLVYLLFQHTLNLTTPSPCLQPTHRRHRLRLPERLLARGRCVAGAGAARNRGRRSKRRRSAAAAPHAGQRGAGVGKQRRGDTALAERRRVCARGGVGYGEAAVLGV
ncbi:hypothetical protein BC567DRAFT_20532 [Phyllosticta citribraziliensis]